MTGPDGLLPSAVADTLSRLASRLVYQDYAPPVEGVHLCASAQLWRTVYLLNGQLTCTECRDTLWSHPCVLPTKYHAGNSVNHYRRESTNLILLLEAGREEAEAVAMHNRPRDADDDNEDDGSHQDSKRSIHIFSLCCSV
jgi:hypothetical protein